MATAVAAEPIFTGARLRRGPGYWLASYLSMVRWQLASFRLFLPVMAAVQLLAGVGLVLGFGLFFPAHVPPRSALYVSTGVPVINLYLVGLVLLPQIVSQQKLAKTYDFIQSMPVPRTIAFLAWYTLTLMVGVPAMIASLVTAGIRYHQVFAVSWWSIPATLLVSLCSIAVGYALGNAVNQPMVTQVATQVLNFMALGFAPVCFPPEQLPGWLQALNHGLPFESMAVVMRSALTTGSADNVPAAYAVLAAWSVVCLGIAGWSVMRRA
jgi:ABC-2 type transport system permease protein